MEMKSSYCISQDASLSTNVAFSKCCGTTIEAKLLKTSMTKTFLISSKLYRFSAAIWTSNSSM